MTLTEWIRRSGFTQGEVARRLGISQSYLSEICSGTKPPGLRVAVAIERATEGIVRPHDFVAEQSGGES